MEGAVRSNPNFQQNNDRQVKVNHQNFENLNPRSQINPNLHA